MSDDTHETWTPLHLAVQRVLTKLEGAIGPRVVDDERDDIHGGTEGAADKKRAADDKPFSRAFHRYKKLGACAPRVGRSGVVAG